MFPQFEKYSIYPKLDYQIITTSDTIMKKELSKKCNLGDLCPNCKAEVLSILSKHFSNVIKVYLVCTRCGSKKNEKLLNIYK